MPGVDRAHIRGTCCNVCCDVCFDDGDVRYGNCLRDVNAFFPSAELPAAAFPFHGATTHTVNIATMACMIHERVVGKPPGQLWCHTSPFVREVRRRLHHMQRTANVQQKRVKCTRHPQR